MKNYIIFLLFVFICLANSKELDLIKRNNWNSCINITTPYESEPEPACVTFQVTSNCGGRMTFSIGGITLYDKEITVDFPPKIDIQYQGCALALVLVDINNAQGHFCVQLQATCGVIPIRTYSFGCVTDELLKNCVGCPNNCTGNGACTNGECTCFQGWSGFDCSERAPLYEYCSPVPYLDVQICIRVRYGNCKMGYSFLVNNNTISSFYVPAHQLENNPQNKNCFTYSGCDLCLTTKNFKGNSTAVSACLDLNVNCIFNQTADYGCFNQYGNFEWPCSNCPGNCSGNGQCQSDGSCICEMNYFGESCQYLRCKDDCNGNGVCNQGICECFTNYIAPYCTKPSPTTNPSTKTPHHSSSSSEEHHERDHKKDVIIAIVVMLVIAGIVGGLVVFFRLKKKREQNTLHFASINDDE